MFVVFGRKEGVGGCGSWMEGFGRGEGVDLIGDFLVVESVSGGFRGCEGSLEEGVSIKE